MAMKKKPMGQAADDMCRKFPTVATTSLAKTLAREFKCSIETARCAIRLARGNHGKEMRGNATSPRPNGKSGAKTYRCPPSKAASWEKFELNDGKIGIINDIHIPYHDRRAVMAAVNTLKKAKIHTLLINGDLGDWYATSRWQQDPRKRKLAQEVIAQREFLGWLRQEFKRAQIVFKLGNHDERWDLWMWNNNQELYLLDDELALYESEEDGKEAVPIFDIRRWLKTENVGVEVVAEQRPIMAGHLPIFHGHELPAGGANAVNPSRGSYLRTAHSVLTGHLHRSSSHTEPDLWKKETTTWSVGCLCGMTPEYARINKWNWGFALVDVAVDRQFDVTNYRINRDYQVRNS